MAERDWASTLLPASWNGIPFYVESDDEKVGARLPTTDIPFGGWVVENFGRKRREFNVTAYIAQDAIEAMGQAFLAACETGAPGILSLPMAGFVFCRIKEAKRAFKKDQLGYLAFTIDAQEESPGFSGLTANTARALVYGLTARLIVPIALGFASRVLAGMTTPAAEERVVQQSGASLNTLAAIRLDIRPGADAAAIIDDGLAAAREQTAIVLADPAAWASSTLRAWQILGEQADPAFGEAVVSSAPIPSAPWAPGWASGGEIDRAFEILNRAGFALAVVELVTRRTYVARPDAVVSRSAAAALVGRARDLLTGTDGEGGQIFGQIESALGSYLSIVAADLAPLVQIRTQVSQPALWWAWRLHGSIDPAGEIRARAGAKNPLFMPREFQTVAPQ